MQLIGLDVLKKALHAKRHPGISEDVGLLGLAYQGLPYLTSPEGRARPPITIYWNVNSVCNLRCKMCDVGTFNEESNFYKNLRIDRKLHEITLEKFKSVVDEVAKFHPVMSINGTEPMMYKSLGEATTYANKAGLRVAVTTGAYNLPERAEELARAGLTRLNVSLDGPPEIHNWIRGRKDVFERATDGIRKFKSAARDLGRNVEVLALFTISNLNYDRLYEFIESLEGVPIDRINFTNMNFVTKDLELKHNLRWGKKYPATVNCLSDEVQPSRVDIDVLWSQIEQVIRRQDPRISFMPDFGKEALLQYYSRPTEFMGNIPCMSSWYIAQVMADGEVIPYTRCYHVPFGNINENSFMEVWNSPAANAWRRDLRANGRFPACTRCDMVY